MDNINYFPCPICKRMVIVEYAKTGKPYCKCNDCGVQLFVRGKDGIARLKKLLGEVEVRGNSKDLINTVDYFNTLRERLEEVQEEKPLFTVDPDLELQEKAIKQQLDKLRQSLKKEVGSKK